MDIFCHILDAQSFFPSLRVGAVCPPGAPGTALCKHMLSLLVSYIIFVAVILVFGVIPLLVRPLMRVTTLLFCLLNPLRILWRLFQKLTSRGRKRKRGIWLPLPSDRFPTAAKVHRRRGQRYAGTYRGPVSVLYLNQINNQEPETGDGRIVGGKTDPLVKMQKGTGPVGSAQVRGVDQRGHGDAPISRTPQRSPNGINVRKASRRSSGHGRRRRKTR